MNSPALPSSRPSAPHAVVSRAVSVWELLHEALHTAAHRCEGGTMTYTSGLLGVPVARASLLALADQLASSHSGLEGRILRLEGHDEEGTVLVENDRRGRRLRLSHGYWPGVRRLCQQTGCRHELARYRTLCDTHMKAAGPSAVREQTTLVAEELRMDREAADFNASEAMRQLMEAALAVGIPAAGHARYFAERLHLADAETAEDWEYDEHEHEIRQDEVRLLLCIGTQLQREQTPVDRGAARPIGPADPRQLPGSPDHLTLDFSCTTGGMPLGRVDDDIQYWQVGVHHRVPDTARRTGERDRGQVGQLALLRVGWGQDTHLLDGTDAGFNTGLTARAAYDAVDDPSSAIHQLGLRAEGDLLLLLTVELDPAWRGFGLGAFLARQALHVLGRGCRVVATTCVEDADSPTGRLMLAAGFRPVSPLLAVLDPSSSGQTVQERLLHRHHLDRLVTLRDPDRDAEPPL